MLSALNTCLARAHSNVWQPLDNFLPIFRSQLSMDLRVCVCVCVIAWKCAHMLARACLSLQVWKQARIASRVRLHVCVCMFALLSAEVCNEIAVVNSTRTRARASADRHAHECAFMHRHLGASVGHQEMKGSFSLDGDERIEKEQRWRKRMSVCCLMQIPETETV